jgi:phage-related protein (TIGR01555 family)
MLKQFLKLMGLQVITDPPPTEPLPLSRREAEPEDERLDKTESPVGFARKNKHLDRLRQPTGAPGVTMDSHYSATIDGAPFTQSNSLAGERTALPEAVWDWFVGQTFLGYTVCAQIAQHWLVDKACAMPGRDAIRHGYEIKADSQEIIDRLKEMSKQMRVDRNMREMVHFGRVFGGRLVLFRVLHTDPEYYEKPFNLDAVGPGMYVGMSQIDPQWITPDLTNASLMDPAAPTFYEPEYYRVGNQRYHRSHFHIFVPFPVPDVLKPRYNYMGKSIPQMIYERVYAAERSANEAPQLLMTKRLNVIQVTKAAIGKMTSLYDKLLEWSGYRDNYGVLVTGDNETVTQHDTALGDVDSVIMSQYQVVASIAGVPATKLLGTQPKGFNASGEYEESVYREELESVQTNDLQPLLETHLNLCMRSARLPGSVAVSFEQLDSPTAVEWATINKTKADTAAVLITSQVLTSQEVREQLAEDKNSDFHGIAPDAGPDIMNELLDPEDPTDGLAPDTETPNMGASA